MNACAHCGREFEEGDMALGLIGKSTMGALIPFHAEGDCARGYARLCDGPFNENADIPGVDVSSGSDEDPPTAA